VRQRDAVHINRQQGNQDVAWIDLECQAAGSAATGGQTLAFNVVGFI